MKIPLNYKITDVYKSGQGACPHVPQKRDQEPVPHTYIPLLPHIVE
jgi:hypothetical protein